MGRIVLVTGGAKGIGKAIVQELSKNGYDIIINYLTSRTEALALKDEIIKENGIRALAIRADISK